MPDSINPNPPVVDDSASAAPDASVDIDAKITAALQAQSVAITEQWAQATGYKTPQALAEAKLKEDGKLQELLAVRDAEATTLRQSAINHAVMAAASDAIDPDVVMALLAGKASIDATGSVLVAGKPIKEAVADLLKSKPHLAKPSGNQGSGAGHNAGNGQQKTMLRVDFEKLPAPAKMAFIKSSGIVTE